jgi:acetate---CoA ligase (ADP-forming)
MFRFFIASRFASGRDLFLRYSLYLTQPREKTMSASFLHSLMNPESIAIVGASNNPLKMGTMHALSILKDGFKGNFYPVHPSEKTVLGLQAYADPMDLPEAPDLAIFVLPSRHLLPLFEAFGRRGTKYAIVITAGFNEIGKEGAELERRLKDIADRYGMRFIGPNCMGIVNREASLNTTVMPLIGKTGKLGMISQSGTYVTQTIVYLQKRGIYFSKAVSVGNEANVNIIDVLEYLGDDEHTTAIAMYIETIRDPQRFLEVARAITPRKPIIVQYVGGSEAGGRAGLSHTGAMAGKNYLYNGLFKQAGIIRVDSVEDLYAQGWALSTQPPMRGNRIGIVTNSGGPGSAIADTCEAHGCVMPVFSQALQEKIKPLMPSHAPRGNPVDLTFTVDMSVMTDNIVDLVMESGEVDGVVIHGAMSSGFMRAIFPHLSDLMPGMTVDDLLKQTSREMGPTANKPFKHGIPMTVSSFFDRDDAYTEAYQDAGVPVLDSPEKAARAIAVLVKYANISKRTAFKPAQGLDANPLAVKIIADALKNGQRALDEHDAKKLLACYGIEIPNERLANEVDEAVATAVEIGFPVVMKACDPEIMHKSDKDLVHLNITNTDGVARAFRAIQESAEKKVPVLIAQMIGGRRELLAGITYDDQFGHCLAFGVGGVLTEALNDITYRLAPIGQRDADEMTSELKTAKLLGDYRGMPATDADRLSSLLVRLSQIPHLHPQIREIDINPLIVSGSTPVAVDSLVILF